MTTTEHTREQIVSLIRLQHIDSRINQIDKLRGDLPNDIADLDDEREGLSTRIERYKQELEEHEDRRREAERLISESEGAIERYEKQQLQVRNNREYDALTKEIESHRQRITEAQTSLESFEEFKEESEGNIAEAQARLDELSALVDEKKKELEVVIGDTENEMKDLNKLRDTTAESIDDRYLSAYHRLRDRLRDGRAVVPLIRGAAGGFAVPPQRQVEIRQGNRIVVCEHTGRIIVDENLFIESKPKELPEESDLVEQI
jgi:predicted  nucleic acid-binding Zn-ribbon protein